MKIESYYSIQGDGEFIVLNGAFTLRELREILDEAAQHPFARQVRLAEQIAAELKAKEVDTDDLLA